MARLAAQCARNPEQLSAIEVLADGEIVVLFERDGYKKLTLARFGLQWLETAK